MVPSILPFHPFHSTLHSTQIDRPSPATSLSRDTNGWTALHYATHGQHIKCVKALLSYKGVMDIPDSHGQTALLLAVLTGALKIVLLLLDQGVGAGLALPMQGLGIHCISIVTPVSILFCPHQSPHSARDETGITPLHGAAFAGQAGACQALVEVGANVCSPPPPGTHHHTLQPICFCFYRLLPQVDERDGSGHTALLYACEMGHFEVARVLVENGADLSLRDAVSARWAASHKIGMA